MKSKILYNTLILFMLITTGCFSSKTKIKVEVLQTYQYEGVYDYDKQLTINDKIIDREKDKERVWVLSDRTLAYMLNAVRNANKQNKVDIEANQK